MADFFQKWLSSVMAAVTLALAGAALSLWQRVEQLERFRSEVLPLQFGVELAQVRTSIAVQDQRGLRNEVRIMELESEHRMLEQRTRDLERRQ